MTDVKSLVHTELESSWCAEMAHSNSFSLYTSSFCLHRSGLPKWICKASSTCNWSMLRARSKISNWFVEKWSTHSGRWRRCCPMSDRLRWAKVFWDYMIYDSPGFAVIIIIGISIDFKSRCVRLGVDWKLWHDIFVLQGLIPLTTKITTWTSPCTCTQYGCLRLREDRKQVDETCIGGGIWTQVSVS